MRPAGCPWRALRDPFVVAVIGAHRWWSQGELSTRYGGRIPEALARGIDVFDRALNAIREHDRRLERERAADDDPPPIAPRPGGKRLRTMR